MMRICTCTFISAGVLLSFVGVAGAVPRRHTSRTSAHASVRHSSSRHHAAVHHESASVVMPAERATQIQAALIKQGYLTGEPSGMWDAQTAAAMQKLQADNGWQSKVTPDSRALIKLGLGPQTSQSPQSGDQASVGTHTPPR